MLRFYAIIKTVKVQCDASQYSLQALDARKSARGVCFLCHDSQRKVEKELLSVVFTSGEFHHDVYGRDIKVQNDHKLLLGNLKKPF